MDTEKEVSMATRCGDEPRKLLSVEVIRVSQCLEMHLHRAKD